MSIDETKMLISGYLLYDTQKAIARAEKLDEEQLDPINESIGIFLDILNLFLKFLALFLEEEVIWCYDGIRLIVDAG